MRTFDSPKYVLDLLDYELFSFSFWSVQPAIKCSVVVVIADSECTKRRRALKMEAWIVCERILINLKVVLRGQKLILHSKLLGYECVG